MIMMQLGAYQFEMNTARYNQLQRDTEWLWSRKNRFNSTPSAQFGGMGEDKITLTGVVFGAFRGGVTQVNSMRAEGKKGTPLLLVSMGWEPGRNVFGYWTLQRVAESQSHIDRFGSPEMQEFTLELVYYGERLR